MEGQKNQPRKLSGFCPTRVSAFQKWVKGCRSISDYPKNFGNISEKQPFSEKISDLFFGKGRGLGQSQSKWACCAVAPKAVPPNYFRGSGRQRIKPFKGSTESRPANKYMQVF
jgi:hypothetical protein